MLAAKSSAPAAMLARRVGNAAMAGRGGPTFWSMALMERPSRGTSAKDKRIRRLGPRARRRDR